MVCIDTGLVHVQVAYMKLGVNKRKTSTSHNCHSVGCAGSKFSPCRISWILNLNCQYLALFTLLFYIRHFFFFFLVGRGYIFSLKEISSVTAEILQKFLHDKANDTKATAIPWLFSKNQQRLIII